MTIRIIQQWNGYAPDQIVSGLGSTEEARLIALGFASADLDGPDGGGEIAKFATDASGKVTGITGPDGNEFTLIDGEFGSASGTAFSVPNAYTVGSPATAAQLTASMVDSNGAVVDLAADCFIPPIDATKFRVFAHVLFDANATGHRYLAVEQYFQAATTWTAVAGLYDEKVALAGGKKTAVQLNTPWAPCEPANFPKLRIGVGQDSGGALNCTITGVTFEFMR